MSLEAYPLLIKEEADHLTVVIFTKYSMDADKPVPVVNIPPVSVIGYPTSKAINGRIQGS